MRIYLRFYVPGLLCLLLFGGCGPVMVHTTQNNDHCAIIGKTRAITNKARWPAALDGMPMFRSNLARTGVAASGAEKLRQAWTYCTAGSVFASPVVKAGIAYVASTDQTVTALDIQHGRVVWQFHANGAIFSTPLLDQTFLYVGTVAGTFYALDTTTGKMRWQTQMSPAGAYIWSSPTLASGLVIFGVASSLSEKPKVPGQVIALNAATGQVQWRSYTMPGAAPGAGVWSSPAVDQTRGVVYVGTGDPDDGVQAFRLIDGRLLWHWRSVARDVSDTDIGAGPLLYSDSGGSEHVVVGGKDGRLYSLDANTGRLTWKTQVDRQIFGSPALANGMLYAVGAGDGETTCMELDIETGRERWRFSVKQKGYSSPVVAGNVLYLGIGNGFGPGEGGVDVVDSQHGQIVQQVSLGTTASSSPAVIAHWVLIGTSNGAINAFVRE